MTKTENNNSLDIILLIMEFRDVNKVRLKKVNIKTLEVK